MTTSDIVAIALLLIAITDTILARHLLPNILDKHELINEAQKRKLLRIVHGGTFAFAGAAIFIYLTQILG